MKAVLMSIKPEWVAKILKGEKTVEVRKTKPKMDTPFKVYIYCTKSKFKYDDDRKSITLDEMYTNLSRSGKVVAEFTCDEICEIPCDSAAHKSYCKDSCLTLDDFINYCNGKSLYAWHISDLKIYDEPKKLNDFENIKKIRGYHHPGDTGIERLKRSRRVEVTIISRPPQSWCYVEEEK